MKLPASIESVTGLASKLVTPSAEEEEKLRGVASRVRRMLEASFARASIVPEVLLGGSYAKGTWLKDEADIDFFLLYPPSYPRESLEKESIGLALKAVKGLSVNLRFAEHPYVEAFLSGSRINLVPCYKVEKGKWQSAVDRSPFHTEYIKSAFDEDKRRETRLLKQFAKSAGVYGAEIRMRGFSGYVCESLILKYGSFVSTLEVFSDLKKGQVISVEPYDDALAASFSAPVVILDPVDTKRNLGAAISMENLGRLMIRARHFTKKPSISYFLDPNPDAQVKLDRELLKRTVVVTFRASHRSADVLWGQLRRSVSSIGSRLDALGFKVLRADAASNDHRECALVFLVLEKEIGEYQVRFGPDVFRREDLEHYFLKNKRKFALSWIDSEGKVASVFRREPDSLNVHSVLKDEFLNPFKNRSLGLSPKIRIELKRGFKILDGLSVEQDRKKSNEWLRDCLSSILSSEID